MRADEVRAMGHRGGQLVGELAGWAEQVHRAVATRTFRRLGVVALPVRQVHDVLAGASYAAVRAAGQAGGDVAGAVLAGFAGDEAS